MLAQHALWCVCGAATLNRLGRCARCDRRRRLSLEKFGGLRDHALARDGERCQACGSLDDLCVHHRRPGVHRLPLLLTLCRPCHARIHATWRPGFGFPAELRRLWREANPGLAEQIELALRVGEVAAAPVQPRLCGEW
jgi:hypothetical protein